jgi:phage baseplate assembly protein W
VTQAVRRALTTYERRIDVLGVDVDAPADEPNLLLIRVSYRIRANNAMGNLVYPFYIREAA